MGYMSYLSDTYKSLNYLEEGFLGNSLEFIIYPIVYKLYYNWINYLYASTHQTSVYQPKRQHTNMSTNGLVVLVSGLQYFFY